MCKSTSNPRTEEYLQDRLSRLYDEEVVQRVMKHVREKGASLREDPESPIQSELNNLIYPFTIGLEALEMEGYPIEEASPVLKKIWEEMPDDIKKSGVC